MANASNPELPENTDPDVSLGMEPSSRIRGDREEPGDTDPLFEDHPEMAPDQSRISTGRMEESGKLSIRRTANTGDLNAESGDGAAHGEPPAKPLGFARNPDFSGDDGKLSTDADFSRGSGWIGGKLWGEDNLGSSSRENTPPEQADPQGFPPSDNQARNRDAAEGLERGADSSNVGAGVPRGDLRAQGRDLGGRIQATASQAFGRDVGASGLPGNAAPEEEGAGIFQKGSMGRENADWTAVLGRLGGSSPGSEENLRLGEIFQRVKFPADRGQVLEKLDPGVEFQVKPGRAVNVREAVEQSRASEFRNLNDLIDCVKDALRRADALERNPAT